MRHPDRTRPLALAVVAACLLLTSCGATQPTRFFTLSSLLAAPGEAAPAAPRELAVGVGPINLPAYLDRPQLVTRDGSNRVILADFDSWAEPLEGLFARTLAENLSLLLDTDDVLILPQRRPIRLGYQVEVDVTRFDVDTSGNAVLDARWWIFGARDEEPLHTARSTLVEQTSPGDHAAAAQGLSRAVGTLSREIATAIVDQAAK